MAKDEVRLNEADGSLGIISENFGYSSSTSNNECSDCSDCNECADCPDCTDCEWDSDCPKDCSDRVDTD